MLYQLFLLLFCIFFIPPISICLGRFFMEKLSLPIRSESASKLKLFAPCKVAYKRFLYSSVIAFFDSFTLASKDIPRTPKNYMETKPWDFVYRNISYKFLRLIFSSPSGTSPSGTINNPLIRGNQFQGIIHFE